MLSSALALTAAAMKIAAARIAMRFVWIIYLSHLVSGPRGAWSRMVMTGLDDIHREGTVTKE